MTVPCSGHHAEPADSALHSVLVRQLLARCTFPPPGTPLTCAVSGGADSLALLALAVAARCEVTAVHVDHGLRPGSAAEASVVEAAANRFGASFRAERAPVERGPNLEARARAARRAVLPPDACTGHTADDQAETVVLNLVRGAGLDGMAGMAPGPSKPILGLRRAETKALCDALDLEVVADPSNLDPVHRRNRVRHEVLPLLDDVAERDVADVIARQAVLLRDELATLDTLAASIDPTDAGALAAAPPALARRAVRHWLRDADRGACTGGEDAYPPDAATVERVLAVARNEAKGTDVGGGWQVRRTAGRLRLVPPD